MPPGLPVLGGYVRSNMAGRILPMPLDACHLYPFTPGLIVVAFRTPVTSQVDQGCDHAAVAGASHDAREPQHIGASITPQLPEIDVPAIAHPRRVSPEQPREMYAHGEVIDVWRVGLSS